MTDAFDIQRQQDNAGADLEDELKEKLEDAKDSTRERNTRLVELSDGHYYDPLGKVILQKTGSQYTALEHDQRTVDLDEAGLRIESGNEGFRELPSGLFWNAEKKHLYVKQANKYVLYSLDRRKGPAEAVLVERRT